MSLPSVVAASLLSLGLLAAATAPPAVADPLVPQLGRQRVLLVSVADADDPRLAAQRGAFGAMAGGAAERDLVLVEAVGEGARAMAIRAAYGLDGHVFTVLLIGKDGGTKLRSPAPLGGNQLFPTIDAMPMRQTEMRRAKRVKAQ